MGLSIMTALSFKIQNQLHLKPLSVLNGLKQTGNVQLGTFTLRSAMQQLNIVMKSCLSLAADHSLRPWAVISDGTFANITNCKIRNK